MWEFLFLYFLSFWTFASIYIIFKSIKVEQIQVRNKTVQNLANTTITFIKGLPAIIATFLALIMRSNDSLFFLFLVGAFFFCFAGDIGMEKDILIGLSLFLVAQMLFSIAFLSQAFTIGPSVNVLFLVAFVVVGIFLYMFKFLQYLESSETGLGELKIPVLAYCVVISLMVVSSFLLWGALESFEAIVVVLGAGIFVISDSIIGVHEFHHKVSGSVSKVMLTYYTAIFLLSLSVLLF